MTKAEMYWTEREVLAIFLGICRGLLALHSLDPPIAHRDINTFPHHFCVSTNSPIQCMNVLLGDDNEPLLMDLGSAAVARRTIRKISI